MINQENAEGILVGCNHYQEWLLPWWWQGYLTHNHYPVAFADFGMSERAKAWCRQRGELISLNLTCDFITPKEQIDDARIQMWSQIYSSNLWPSRSSWFKKPFALLQAPFKSAIWIDLDCEIHGCLAPLFEYCDNPCGIAVAQEFDFVQEKERSVGLILQEETTYNAGVICFQKQAHILQEWAELSLTRNAEFIGDQHVLSRILLERKGKYRELPALYNWTMHNNFKENPDALITHWIGGNGKLKIIEKISLLASLQPHLKEELTSLIQL